MRYETPQFIEIEAKIVGFLTLRQFGFIAVAFAIDLVLYLLFKPFVVIMVGIPITGVAAAFAFIKVNGQPFANYVSNALRFAFKPKMYVWRKGNHD